MSDNILFGRRPAVATITINRPVQRNAISFQMWGELSQILTDLETPTVSVIRGHAAED